MKFCIQKPLELTSSNQVMQRIESMKWNNHIAFPYCQCGYSPLSRIHPFCARKRKQSAQSPCKGTVICRKPQLSGSLPVTLSATHQKVPDLTCITRDLLIPTGQGTCSLGFPVRYIYMAFPHIPQAHHHKISLGGQSFKWTCFCQYRKHKRGRFNPWVRKIPWRRAWQPTPVFLPRESHGQRSLVGYSS